MRIATFESGGVIGVGIVQADMICPLGQAYSAFALGTPPESVAALIAGGAPELDRLREAAAAARSEAGLWTPLSSVQLLAPIPRPTKNVFCVGRNYRLHIEEAARARGAEPSYPAVPEFFSKPPTTVIGPEAEIRWNPALTSQLDYEVELAIVIGQRCRDLQPEEVDAVIFGYTIANDVSARDLQRAHGQWFKGKSLDTTLPCGPWIVTADEFGEPATRGIKLRVNSEERQNSIVGDMLFDCRAIVASLSAGTTLEPGDLICTGTPSGVGLGMRPQCFLKDGDVVECEIDGIGILRNRVLESGLSAAGAIG